MKVDFTLSLDDYIEWQNSRRQTPDLRMLFGTAFGGFVLLAVGYFLLRHGCGAPFVPGGLALFLGLAIPVAAVLVGFPVCILLGRQHRMRVLREYEFDYVHRGACSFEADESGWHFAFDEGNDWRPWSHLSWVSDRADTLLLADDTSGVCAIPRSALSQDQLNELHGLFQKSFVPSEKLCSVSMISPAADFAAAMAMHNWKKRLGTMLALYCVGLLSAGFLALVIADSWPGLSVPALIPLLLLLPLVELAYYWKKFADTYRGRQYHTADVLDDSLCLYAGTLVGTYEIRRVRYSWISEAWELRHGFMLYVGPNVFYLVPKSGFEPEQLDRFRDFLRTEGA